MTNILFRCDGSIKIGMGHVIRCLALADHLKENHGCKIHFAMRKSELGINRVKKSYPVIEANEQSFDYVDWFFDCISQTQSKILIMDMRDGLTKEQLKLIKKKTGIKVVTIDDPEDKRLEADLAFYPPVPQLEKISWDGYLGGLFVGWEYVVLRDKFSINYPDSRDITPKIFLSMGGTDENNITDFVINTLNEIKEKFQMIIVVGGGYPYLNQLKKSLSVVGFNYDLYQNPDNIAKIMSQADFAIISFGQTAYELVALEVPMLYLCITQDHLDSSQLFENNKIGESLGIYPFVDNSVFINKVTKVIKNNDILEDMVNSSKSLNISNLDLISKIILKGDKYV